MRTTRTILLAVVASLGLMSTQATAQEIFKPPEVPGIDNFAGLAFGFVPDFEGSDEYTFGIGPLASINLGGERYAQLLATNLQVNLLDNPRFALGPAFNYRFGRGDGIEDAVVKLLAEVDDSVEVGLFGGYKWVDPDNPRNRFVSTLEILQDVSDGHGGMLANLSLRYGFQITRALDLYLGGGLSWASNDYMDSFYSVSPSDAAASGLAEFSATGRTARDFSLSPTLLMHFSQSWHVAAAVQWQVLLADAANSPIVDTRGNNSQLVLGIAAIYAW